jgi:outer membrane phospholipase A
MDRGEESMKKIILFILLVLITYSLAAQENPWVAALSGYKPLYIITGVGDDQVKLRMSFKFDLFHPQKLGFYIGYSQLMFWDLYKLSQPFIHINFNFETFWRFQSGYNFADDLDIPFIDYIQLGLWEHISNGMPAPVDETLSNLSRGIDRIYFQVQSSVGEKYKFGINLKIFHVFFITFNDEPHDNPDIQEYIGSFVCRPFIHWYNSELDDYMELYGEFAAGGGVFGLDFDKGFLEIGFKSYKLLSRFRIYAQYYQGYFESISTYDTPTRNTIIEDGGEATEWPFSFRVGVIIE